MSKKNQTAVKQAEETTKESVGADTAENSSETVEAGVEQEVKVSTEVDGPIEEIDTLIATIKGLSFEDISFSKAQSDALVHLNKARSLVNFISASLKDPNYK